MKIILKIHAADNGRRTMDDERSEPSFITATICIPYTKLIEVRCFTKAAKDSLHILKEFDFDSMTNASSLNARIE